MSDQDETSSEPSGMQDSEACRLLNHEDLLLRVRCVSFCTGLLGHVSKLALPTTAVRVEIMSTDVACLDPSQYLPVSIIIGIFVIVMCSCGSAFCRSCTATIESSKSHA